MAPPHNQPHLSLPPLPLSLSTEHHRRCSTAQMCFFKILHIISVIPPADVTVTTCQTHDDRPKNNEEESESAVEEERGTEHSEISHVGDQSSGVDYNGVSNQLIEQEQEQVQEKPKDEGYLGLLIEAAQLILGGDDCEPDEKPPSRATEPRRSKRKPQCWTAAAEAEWYAEYEDTSPVVKSKRGRNQVLPFKYRDSVVEPLVRWTSSCKSISRRAK